MGRPYGGRRTPPGRPRP